MMPENALWSYAALNVRNLFTTSNNLLRIQGMSCTCRLTFLPLRNLLWFIPALTVAAVYTKYPRNLQSAFPIHLQLALKSHYTISALAQRRSHRPLWRLTAGISHSSNTDESKRLSPAPLTVAFLCKPSIGFTQR